MFISFVLLCLLAVFLCYFVGELSLRHVVLPELSGGLKLELLWRLEGLVYLIKLLVVVENVFWFVSNKQITRSRLQYKYILAIVIISICLLVSIILLLSCL